MLNENAELSEQELRKIVATAILEYRQSVWLGEDEKARVFVQKEFGLRFELWKKAAELGVPEAQWFIGSCYENGIGTKKDDGEAVRWYQPAAEQGSPESQTSLANCLYYGQGVDENKAAAVKLYRVAADHGYAEAQNSLGICYINGDGVSEDSKEAVKWLQMAAVQGYPPAQTSLADCLQSGNGIELNDTEAVKWYRSAADQGYPEAENSLADCLRDGAGVEKNEAESAKWYRIAAEHGLAEAQWNLGFCYNQGRGVQCDDTEAVKWFRKAAEQGYSDAQISLANCLLDGVGIEKNAVEAVKWFRAAADQGNDDAQNRLGLLYDEGKIIPKDKAQAVALYQKAADQDNYFAQYNLAMMYRFGQGVSKDRTTAAAWFRKAAEYGLDRAQYRLGCLYLDGKGVARDETEGIKWLLKAAEQHYSPATRRLNKLRSGGPAEPDSVTPNEEPVQASPSPQATSEQHLEEKKAEEEGGVSVAAAELVVIQCKCGRLFSTPYRVDGSECECLSCHAGIKILAGPNPKTYLIADRFPEHKENTPQAIYATSISAVVTIVADDGTGSGFFVTSDGVIITNNHVVDGCASVLVKQSGAASVRGRVFRSFHHLDLAFIKVHTPRIIPYVRLAPQDQAQVGEAAFAIGSPHEFEGTFTEGCISGIDRVIDGCHFIQTDAPINPGNSGGPLLNAFGEVVGVNTLIRNDSQNINFAIPVSVVRDCLYEVERNRCVDKKYCTTCGYASADTSYCDNCGVKFDSANDAAQQSAVTVPQVAEQHKDGCAVCGAKLDPDSSYCPRCGTASNRGEIK